MRAFGLLLITIGFVGAAFFSVRRADAAGLEWSTIEWGYYVPFLITGMIGVAVVRVAATARLGEIHRIDADLRTIDDSLRRLARKLEHLCSEAGSMNVYDVHGWIDANLAEDLGDFVEAREVLIGAYGLQPYANLMNEFAGSERNINRAWCASADGYVNEVATCLRHAASQMKQARNLFLACQSATPDDSPLKDADRHR